MVYNVLRLSTIITKITVFSKGSFKSNKIKRALHETCSRQNYE